jgi:cyanophycin synthetase
MMVLLTPLVGSESHVSLPPSFRRWQKAAIAAGTLPIIGIAGSRGKSTVVRLLDAIFTGAGLRTAVWTDRGVEVAGRRQRGELAGWSRALNHVADGMVDVALQELDWATVNAVGLPPATYPVIAVTNLCNNSETCLVDYFARQALKALPVVKEATCRDGTLILNGDDFSLLAEDQSLTRNVLMTALSGDSPAIRSRRLSGELGLWIAHETLVVGDGVTRATPILQLSDVPLTLYGEASFESSNVLVAAAVSLACGLGVDAIQAGVCGFGASPSTLSGSFNVHHLQGARVFVDRVNPPWFLRPILRAVNPGGKSDLVTVIGSLDRFGEEQSYQLGRLLGRYRGAVISHSTKDAARLDAFRQGLTVSSVPPVMIRLPTERRALNRALKAIKPGTQLFILTDEPDAINRTLNRLSVA